MHGKNYKPIFKWPLIFLVFAAIIFASLQLTHVIHLSFSSAPKPTPTTGNSYTKGVTKSDSVSGSKTKSVNSQNFNQPQNNTTKDTNPSGDTSSRTLLAPWGTFANTYSANINTQMGSTCNTSPGATCQIIFTNGSISKALDTETTDAGGAVYWSWTPQEIGLTPGTWHILAKATLGSQIKTTNNDPLTLGLTQ